MNMRRSFLGLGAAGVLLVSGWVVLAPGSLAQSETTILGNVISRALSTPTAHVQIGSVDGALSSDATIRNVTVADRDGVWLRLDRARLVWRRSALLSRRLEVDRLEVGRLEVLRRPLPAEVDLPTALESESLLPELPLKVEVKAFSLAELALGEPVLGTGARLAASGAARLGPPAEGLALTFEARRLDAEGRFTARLGYVPRGERLELKLDHDEPAGGLLARAANLPGLPTVRLELDGRGPLDDWAASLAFRAGEGIGAQGGARLVREGAERRLTLDLASQVDGLLPAAVAPVFAGTTQLQGTVRLGDGGAVGIERLDLASRTASLTLSGGLSADQVLDVAVTARARPTDGETTRAAGAEIASLAFDGSAKGPIRAPRIAGRLAAAGVHLPQGSLARLEASLSAEPRDGTPSATAGTEQRFAVNADARAEGVNLVDPALRAAVGDRVELALRSSWGQDGVGEIEHLRLVNPSLKARYQGRLGSRILAGTLQADLRDISVLTGLAGRPLAGALTATARLDGDPGAGSVLADVTAEGRAIGLGLPAADRLTGGRLTARGRIRTLPGGFGLERLSIEGAHARAELNGEATQARAAIDARLRLADLARIDDGLAGAAEVTARLAGSLARPEVSATVTTHEARALDRPLRDIKLDVVARDLTGAFDGGARLTGMVGGKPLAGSVRLRRLPDAWSLDEFNLTAGAATLAGRARLTTGSGLADGALTLAAPDLDDLSPFLLTPLSGALRGELVFAREGGDRQQARLSAVGRRIHALGMSLAGVDANISGSDLFGKPVLDGRVSADQLVLGGETVNEVRLEARGDPAASDLALTGTARGFALAARARLVNAERTRIDLATLTAERRGQRLALAQPATILLDDGAALISDLTIAANGGRVGLNGRIGRSLDLKVAIRSLPLSMVEIAQPGLALAGTLDGEVDLRGPVARPDGRYRLALARFAAPQTREAGLPPIDADAALPNGPGRGRVDRGKAASASMRRSPPARPRGSRSLVRRRSTRAARSPCGRAATSMRRSPTGA